MTETRSGLSVLCFANPGEFKTWLAKQPRDTAGLWIKFAKKTATSAMTARAPAPSRSVPTAERFRTCRATTAT